VANEGTVELVESGIVVRLRDGVKCDWQPSKENFVLMRNAGALIARSRAYVRRHSRPEDAEART